MSAESNKTLAVMSSGSAFIFLQSRHQHDNLQQKKFKIKRDKIKKINCFARSSPWISLRRPPLKTDDQFLEQGMHSAELEIIQIFSRLGFLWSSFCDALRSFRNSKSGDQTEGSKADGVSKIGSILNFSVFSSAAE
jgi:hypothetical protein